jgi:2-iminobutanoate/2-iminopropanoate deaminase
MTHHRATINAPDAPAAVGAYSHAVKAGNLLFCSGQIPLDPATQNILGNTFSEQARQCLTNLERVVAAAGAQLKDAVRVTIYLTDMSKFEEVNSVYGEFFSIDPPARVTIGVAALPKGALVELDAVVAMTR